jgi:hypothetical protein
MRARHWREIVFIGVLSLSSLWLGSLIWGLAGKAEIAVGQAHQTKGQYLELEARKAKLEEDLRVLNTTRGQDAAIRDTFSVAKEGEEVIVVVPPTPATTTPEKSLWEKFLGWF